MIESNISINIAELRKGKGITQEALAEEFNLTPQAVSKWESGGSPDASLLPALADYFEVSIDRLFGRKGFDYTEIELKARAYLTTLPVEERVKRAYDICFNTQYSFVDMSIPEDLSEILMSVNEVSAMGTEHGEVFTNKGLVKTGIGEALRYFLLMPKPEDGWGNKLKFKEEYSRLFAYLGQEDILKSLFFLESRKNKSFTSKLLEKAFDLSDKRATEVLKVFVEYGLVEEKELELDEELKFIYEYNSNLSILPFFTFVEEIIKRPEMFYVLWNDVSEPLLAGTHEKSVINRDNRKSLETYKSNENERESLGTDTLNESEREPLKTTASSERDVIKYEKVQVNREVKANE
jgi:transcriptional regulator with XRE-family HTH domain